MQGLDPYNSSMSSLKKILVGLDFSEVCWAALRRAVWIAQSWDASIKVLHVLQEFPYEGAGQKSNLVEAMNQLEEEASEELSKRVQEIVMDQVRSETKVSVGTPYQEVLKAAGDEKVDLIVLGNESRSGLDGWVLGRTCETILRNSPVPVWIERQGVSGEIRSLLLPTDLSENSRLGIDQGLAWARQIRAKVFFIHVADVPFVPSFSMIDPKDYEESMAQMGNEKFQEFISDLPLGDLQTETIFSMGDPGREILKAAKDKEIDLIALTTHGNTGLANRKLGTVATHLTRHAPCATLTLRSLHLELT